MKDLQLCLAGPWELVSPGHLGLQLDVEESGLTYLENARLKALAYSAATGLPTLADDSGLEIDALNGEPGVFSARYLGLPDGPIKNARVLELLAGVPTSRRGCRYRCVMVFLEPGCAERSVEGICAGQIAQAPAGQAGFGFDPIVRIPRLGRTLAELTEAERVQVNHRGRAARKLLSYLKTRPGS